VPGVIAALVILNNDKGDKGNYKQGYNQGYNQCYNQGQRSNVYGNQQQNSGWQGW
jgi:hypothetical protein